MLIIDKLTTGDRYSKQIGIEILENDKNPICFTYFAQYFFSLLKILRLENLRQLEKSNGFVLEQ